MVEDVSGGKQNRTLKPRPQLLYLLAAINNRSTSANPKQNLTDCLPGLMFGRIALVIRRWCLGPLCGVIDRRLDVLVLGAMGVHRFAGMVHVTRRAAKMKCTVGDDLCAAFLVNADRTAEMIRMRMRDEDRVDMSWLEPRLLQAMQDRFPRRVSRKAGIDDGSTVLVDERVHVDMAEAGHGDRELHAKNVIRNLADLRLCIFLFLSSGSIHCPRL